MLGVLTSYSLVILLVLCLELTVSFVLLMGTDAVDRNTFVINDTVKTAHIHVIFILISFISTWYLFSSQVAQCSVKWEMFTSFYFRCFWHLALCRIQDEMEYLIWWCQSHQRRRIQQGANLFWKTRGQNLTLCKFPSLQLGQNTENLKLAKILDIQYKYSNCSRTNHTVTRDRK